MTMPSYRILRSARKTIAIQITPEGEVLVRCPRRLPESQIRDFVERKQGWIQRHLQDLQSLPALPPYTREELTAMAETLSPVLKARTAHFAACIGVSYGRITIRSQRSRWGSCSAKGNLNFNCLLSQAPAEVLDYIIVHELCHRKELNHSPRFWAEVARILPDYRQQELWLKSKGRALIRRLPG